MRTREAKLGIGFVNLFPAFHAKAAEAPQTLFHAAEQHWNAAGHARASRVLAEAIVRSQAPTQSGVGTKPTPPGASRSE